MSLSREDVLHLADLARLQLSEDEIASAQNDLGNILNFIDQLKEVDTDGVEPMTMPARAEGWREDVAVPVDESVRELILSNFPKRKGDLLATPGVFEKPKGGK
jgi:aspartyl-tRNA(Asn)/glutamyl-tRNA(Gln) amidotransferase subunit C